MYAGTATASEPTLLLSVGLVVGARRNRGRCALDALLAQSIVPRMEILVVDVGHRERPPLTGVDHPNVRLLRAEGDMTYGESLALVARAARGPVVAFVEEHVLVQAGWAEALVRAHEGPYAAVTAEVIPGDLSNGVARRIELVSRNDWSPPARRGEAVVLRWQNVSYKRAALARYEPHLALLLGSEGLLFRQLRADGFSLFIEPAAKIVHARELTWQTFLRGTFHSSRAGAACRIVYQRPGAFTLGVMVAWVLIGAVRWPLVLLRRTWRLPDRRVWLRVALRNLPHVCVYYGLAAVSGAIGLIAGAGDSGVAFLQYEIDEERQRPDALPAATPY